MKNLILASTSTIYGSSHLEYLLDSLQIHFKGVNEILFIPFARPGGITHDAYTAKVAESFKPLDISVNGLHEHNDKSKAIEHAQAIFTGGGNTFVLLKMLYHYNLLHTLRSVLQGGTPYLGTSAGSNICGLSINTTNDMPIVHPPSFKALGLVPFNINPHYLDPESNSTHMGETRAMRIKEYHAYNSPPVVGLREGSWLHIKHDHIVLKGEPTARIFEINKSPYELKSNSDLSVLH
ncbi:MAG: dipeptidase PepE [Winogradskyella sp.]|nr:dipeptidase PepE [Winogradskyella sp.]